MSRPEHTAAAEKFYSKGEAARYDDSARMQATQRSLADRALQLLDLPPSVPQFLLDAGCGTGYSGRPLEKAGHSWIGTDISMNMLRNAVASSAGRRSGRAQVVCGDLGAGFAFRRGLFDGCVSISAVQWLCHASRPEHDPPRRVRKFFAALRAVLCGGARAILQLYPEQPAHMEMLRDAALAAGFGGGLVVDYPWSERSKKLFLVLIAPSRLATNAPTAGPVAPRGKGKGKQKGGSGKQQRDSGGGGIRVVPVAQPRADKLFGKVAQPLPRHYNGQGVAQPSDYVPLSDADFVATFEALWQAHVEFGTTKSHKKLLGKKRKRVEPEGGAAAAALAAVAADAPMKGEKKKKKKPAQTGTSAPPAPPPVVASKGRWESTMAARLLGGG